MYRVNDSELGVSRILRNFSASQGSAPFTVKKNDAPRTENLVRVPNSLRTGRVRDTVSPQTLAALHLQQRNLS